MDPVELHRQLLNPALYPDNPSAVTFRETHISKVYLTDHFAYKLKKPLNLGFLDFSTLALRQYFCQEEIRLNRRFSPDIYLDVINICHSRQGIRFGGKGRIIDYAVRMRRLPEERMLSRLLEANDPDLPVEMERLAGHLAGLLGQVPRCLNEENSDTVREKIAGNLQQILPAIGLSLTPDAHRLISSRMEEEVGRLAELIEQRAVQGYVREGHGDLHAANICMTDPVAVYDCIEFCRRFRVADVAADLAFLLMDLDFRNRRDLGGIFLDSYQRQVCDPGLVRLLPLYKTYRALVRGKVSTLLTMETDVEAELRHQSLNTAWRYFNLALGYHLPPSLIVTSGVMGVGKSTLAKALAEATGATLLRSDVVRKELAGLPSDRPSAEPFLSGLYSEAMNSRTYAKLLERTEPPLRQGGSVIVDAAFSQAAERKDYFALANKLGRPLLFLHLQCPPAAALARLERRQQLGNDPSDGRSELYSLHAAGFAEFDPVLPLLKIDSTLGVDYNVQQVLCTLLQS